MPITVGDQSSQIEKKDGTTETDNTLITSLDKSIFPINYFKDRKNYMKEVEMKLNNEIGYRFWKRYINAAFWSYVSMPINLSITMMTALSTGQATTNNLLPKELYVNISLATLVMSVLNTYFRPYIQMTKNMELMNKWNEMGCQFEAIIYSENKYLEHIEQRLEKYDELMKEVNDLKKTETLDTQNFLTDTIYFGIRSVGWGLKGRDSWLSLDESYKAANSEKHKYNNSTQTVFIDPSAVCIKVEELPNDRESVNTNSTDSEETQLFEAANSIINPEKKLILTNLVKSSVKNAVESSSVNRLNPPKYRKTKNDTATI